MKFKYTMRGVVERRSMGTNSKGELFYSVVFLTEKIVERLPNRGFRARIRGTFEAVPIELGIQPGKNDPPFIIVSKALLERSGALLGDTIELKFDMIDKDTVSVPEELQAALATNAAFRACWEAMSAGKRRTWSVYVDRARRRSTRLAKTKEVVDRVRRGLIDPRSPWP
ncbi:MAG: YdeI/OmpD-associated family protein [Myxococcota bacterium]